MAKSVLGLDDDGRADRSGADRRPRVAAYLWFRNVPKAAVGSHLRVFDEFAQGHLAERVHEVLIKEYLGSELIGHLELRRHGHRRAGAAGLRQERGTGSGEAARDALGEGEVRLPAKESRLQRQSLAELAADARRDSYGMRPADQMQRPGLQDQLERLQVARRYRRLWRAD